MGHATEKKQKTAAQTDPVKRLTGAGFRVAGRLGPLWIAVRDPVRKAVIPKAGFDRSFVTKSPQKTASNLSRVLPWRLRPQPGNRESLRGGGNRFRRGGGERGGGLAGLDGFNPQSESKAGGADTFATVLQAGHGFQPPRKQNSNPRSSAAGYACEGDGPLRLRLSGPG